MDEHSIIEKALRDPDGSNVNFERPTWEGVEALVESLKESFETISGLDHEGRAIVQPLGASVLAVARDEAGYAHLVLKKGCELLNTLQIFISAEERDGAPFVELSFWPGDLTVTDSLPLDFITWARRICNQLEATRYYARDANMSWDFGDTGLRSGVYWVSDGSGESAFVPDAAADWENRY